MILDLHRQGLSVTAIARRAGRDTGAYTAVKRFIAAIRPREAKPYEVRFETPPGQQAQVDFARFVVTFTDAPGTTCIVWLFSLVLGHSRHIEARFLDGGRLVAIHPVMEGRRQYRVDPDHRQGGAARAMRHGHPDGPMIGPMLGRHSDHVARRSLAVYQAVGERLAAGIGGRS